VHVPYKGAAPAVNDLLGGQVQMGIFDVPVLLGHIRAGKLKGLAVTSARRAATLPDVPTTAEGKYPNVTSDNWYGLIVPVATPAEIQRRLTRRRSRPSSPRWPRNTPTAAASPAQHAGGIRGVPRRRAEEWRKVVDDIASEGSWPRPWLLLIAALAGRRCAPRGRERSGLAGQENCPREARS
jgi:hypothetical protein